MAGKLANGMFGLMMNPYVMVAQMVWGYVQQGIEMIKQQEEESQFLEGSVESLLEGVTETEEATTTPETTATSTP